MSQAPPRNTAGLISSYPEEKSSVAFPPSQTLCFSDFSVVPNLPQAQCDMNSGGNSQAKPALRLCFREDSQWSPCHHAPKVTLSWSSACPFLSHTIKYNHHTSVGIQIQKATVPPKSLCFNSSRWLLTPPIAGVWTSELFFFHVSGCKLHWPILLGRSSFYWINFSCTVGKGWTLNQSLPSQLSSVSSL